MACVPHSPSPTRRTCGNGAGFFSPPDRPKAASFSPGSQRSGSCSCPHTSAPGSRSHRPRRTFSLPSAPRPSRRREASCLPDDQARTDTHAIPMGNYVTPPGGELRAHIKAPAGELRDRRQPDFLPRLPDSPLRDPERLARRLQLVHAIPPRELLVDRTNTATNDPAPSLRPHYRSLSATTSRSASVPRDGTQPLAASAPLGDLPLTRPHPRPGSIGTRLLLFRAEAADRARVVYMPDTAWPVSGHPPGSSRSLQNTPVSMSSEWVSTRQQRFACARLPGPHLTPLTTPFPHRSPRRSSANAA